MSLTDLVIPPWLRVAACAVVVVLIFGSGYRTGIWVGDHRSVSKISAAEHARDTADMREVSCRQGSGLRDAPCVDYLLAGESGKPGAISRFCNDSTLLLQLRKHVGEHSAGSGCWRASVGSRGSCAGSTGVRAGLVAQADSDTHSIITIGNDGALRFDSILRPLLNDVAPARLLGSRNGLAAQIALGNVQLPAGAGGIHAVAVGGCH